MFKINGNPIEVTMFPDKTSQVWKLPEELLTKKIITISWYFDNEGEIMHLAQIVDLYRNTTNAVLNLYIDYLPYARQDKKISNNTTFALHSFMKILDTFKFNKIMVLDPHSDFVLLSIPNVHYVSSSPYADLAQQYTNSELICFPDLGAAKRYPGYDNKVIIKKTRNQSTGLITEMDLSPDYVSTIKDKNILIVDDICDGGKTFVEAAKLLYNNKAKEVNLYVTHGIFSKGLKPLFDAGIKRIFTKNGEAVLFRNELTYITYEENL